MKVKFDADSAEYLTVGDILLVIELLKTFQESYEGGSEETLWADHVIDVLHRNINRAALMNKRAFEYANR